MISNLFFLTFCTCLVPVNVAQFWKQRTTLQFGSFNYVRNVQKNPNNLCYAVNRKRQKQPFVSWTAAAADHKVGSESCSDLHGQLKKT